MIRRVADRVYRKGLVFYAVESVHRLVKAAAKEVVGQFEGRSKRATISARVQT